MMENNIQTNVGGRESKKKRRAQRREEREKEKRKGEEKEEEIKKERKKIDGQERKMLTVAFHKFIRNLDLIIEEKEKLYKIESPNT